MLEFAILGPLEVRADGQPVELPGSASRRVLAALAVGYGEWLSADRLIDEVWGERPPEAARKALQTHVWRLRRALAAAVPDPECVLASGPAGYRLDLTAGQLDAVRFERLVEAARSAHAASEPEKARELLVEALGAWRGPPLGGLSLEGATAAERGRLEELRLAALEQRIEIDLQLGRHGEVIGELRRLVSEHPWRERLHAQLMVALYRAGRQADALEAFRAARAVLVEQLGIEPGPQLKRLEREILEHAPTLRQPRLHGRLPLPLPPNPTAGRERDLAATAALVRRADVRLLTLVGPGGVGKTRLALELAHALADDFADGARFIELASTPHARHVLAEIGRALDVTSLSGETPGQALARFLAPKQLLLVLDNLEHLLEAAPAIGDLLAASPGLVVLGTAREPLRLQSETRYRVAPLAPAAARALFRDRARRQDAPAELDADAIERICERLDHLPLAIELAAARLPLLGPRELARRIDGAALALGTAARDAPVRQQTLRATLDWSFQLLSESEQEAFVRLAVFAGGCTVAAAELVTGVSLDVLESLVAKSLLTQGRTDGGEPRLLLLETVREYAAERLAARDEADALRRRHLRHYLELAERSEPELRGAGREIWLPRMNAELDNVRSALGWALAGEHVELALALAGALSEYWWARNAWSEGLRWLRAALDAAGPGISPDLRARAVLAEALLLLLAADYENAAHAADQSLRLYRGMGDAGGIAQSLTVMAGAELHLGQRARAGRLAAEALLAARSVGDNFLIAVALKWKAAAATSFRQALPLMREAVTILTRLGSTRRAATLLSDVGYFALVEQQYGEARALLAEALALARMINDPAPLATIRGNEGLAALFIGDAQAARLAFREELELTRDGVFPRLAAEGLLGMAALAALDGRPERAARLSGASRALSRPWPPEPLEQRTHDEILAPARDQHGHDTWDTALREGEQLAFQAAIDYAFADNTSVSLAEA